MLADKFQRNSNLPFQHIGDELVVVVPREWKTHLIEGVGPRIWDILNEPVHSEEIVVAVCAEYEIDETSARADIEQFLQALLSQNLIRKINS